MAADKIVVLPAATPGYEFEIREHAHSTWLRASFIYRKIWPCEDGIYEAPIIDIRNTFIHVVHTTMCSYLTAAQIDYVEDEFGSPWND